MSPPEIPDEIVDEKSGVHYMPVKKPDVPGGERAWKWVALVLTTILAGAALSGGLGRAFYVTRSEYTERQQNEAVAREGMRTTLERLDRTLNAQAAAFQQLAGEVQGVKIDLAVLTAKKDR